jgi:parallel beta-helix repeat protein
MGITMVKSSNNYFDGNNISFNGENGIFMTTSCNNNIIINNIISYNGDDKNDYGLGIVGDSNHNQIYGNYFIKNGVPLSRNNAFDECENTWNKPYWPGPYEGKEWTPGCGYCGNYWSDHYFALDPLDYNIQDDKYGPNQDLDGWSDKIFDREYGIPPFSIPNLNLFGVNLGKLNNDFFKNYDYLPVYGNSSPIVTCEIKEPVAGGVYINGEKVHHSQVLENAGTCLCIGGIPIEVYATTESDDIGVDGVRIYFDKIDELPEEVIPRLVPGQNTFKTDYRRFYNGNTPILKGIMLFKHKLFAVAVNGHESDWIPPIEGENMMDIWVFNIPGSIPFP